MSYRTRAWWQDEAEAAHARIAEMEATIVFERHANEHNCSKLLDAEARLAAVIALCDVAQSAEHSIGDDEGYAAYYPCVRVSAIRAAAAGDAK